MTTTYSIIDKSAHMPSSCWGQYRRIALIEHDAEIYPAMISPRAKGVVRIVQTWEALNVGKTHRCAYQRALNEAHRMLAKLTTER